MKHASSRILFSYWDSLRGTRAAPERGDIRPGAMRHILADAFLLANERGEEATVRLAGSRICALFGRDLAGSPFGRLWRQADADEIGRALGLVFDDTAGVVMGVLGTNANGSDLAQEMLLLPLRHNGRPSARLIGALSPGTVPSWAGLVPLVALSIRSLRIIEPERPAIGLAGPARSPHPLVVHEGGAL